MPIIISDNLPAKEILKIENIFLMENSQASHQDIRPIKILILNLMPKKMVTETQLLRLIGNSPLQVEITLIHPKSYISSNHFEENLISEYKYFDDIKNEKFDGMVITGAPVQLEQMEFEKVKFWTELTNILEWGKKNVTSTFHMCWGAQAGLYYHFGIRSYQLPEKVFGVFENKINDKNEKLLRGFDDEFYVPHSRYTEIRKNDVEKTKRLKVISESDESGIYLIIADDGKQIFALGHLEYDQFTLQSEYEKDKEEGHKTIIPKNYFSGNKLSKKPIVKWRSHANLLITNWLNYYVYQDTPFVLENHND